MNESTLVAAIHEMSRAALTTAWATPIDLQHHRRQLLRLLDNGSTDYPEPWAYPTVDVDTIDRLADDADLLARRLPTLFRDAVRDQIQRTRSHVHALASRNDTALNEWVHNYQSWPSESDLNEARYILGTPPIRSFDNSSLDSDQIAQHIRSALDAHECRQWTVEVSEAMAAGASVNGTRTTVRVRANQHITTTQLSRLAVHEVGGHVLRWVNSAAQDEPLAAIPLGDTTATEEGLAALLEEEMGVSSQDQLRTYAARSIAVDMSQRGPILEVARSLEGHIGAEQAVQIAIRVKRGLVNPNSPGGPTKDAGYLAGLLALRELSSRDPEAISLLRGTKWSLGYLSLAEQCARKGTLKLPALRPDPDSLLATGSSSHTRVIAAAHYARKGNDGAAKRGDEDEDLLRTPGS